jgi:hypothetical protein
VGDMDGRHGSSFTADHENIQILFVIAKTAQYKRMASFWAAVGTYSDNFRAWFGGHVQDWATSFHVIKRTLGGLYPRGRWRMPCEHLSAIYAAER